MFNSPLIDIGSNDYAFSAWVYINSNAPKDANMRVFSHGTFGCTPGYMFRTNSLHMLAELLARGVVVINVVF